MHVQAETLLQDLAKASHTITLDQKDWDKLYEVALCVHAYGGTPDPKTIKYYLIDHGSSFKKAGFLTRQVLHLCRVLDMYDERRIQTASA